MNEKKSRLGSCEARDDTFINCLFILVLDHKKLEYSLKAYEEITLHLLLTSSINCFLVAQPIETMIEEKMAMIAMAIIVIVTIQV